jgi:hypothetical protein
MADDEGKVWLDIYQASRIAEWLYCLARLADDETALPGARPSDHLTDVQIGLLSDHPAQAHNLDRRELAARLRDHVEMIREQVLDQLGESTPEMAATPPDQTL